MQKDEDAISEDDNGGGGGGGGSEYAVNISLYYYIKQVCVLGRGYPESKRDCR
jgi:hypothetical protein